MFETAIKLFVITFLPFLGYVSSSRYQAVRSQLALERLMRIRRYGLVATTRSEYEKGDAGAHSLDVFLDFASFGQPIAVRHQAAIFATRAYQAIHEHFYGFKPSPVDIKVKFEAEERVLHPTPEASVTAVEHIYRGKQHTPARQLHRRVPLRDVLGI